MHLFRGNCPLFIWQHAQPVIFLVSQKSDQQHQNVPVRVETNNLWSRKQQKLQLFTFISLEHVPVQFLLFSFFLSVFFYDYVFFHHLSSLCLLFSPHFYFILPISHWPRVTIFPFLFSFEFYFFLSSSLLTVKANFHAVSNIDIVLTSKRCGPLLH